MVGHPTRARPALERSSTGERKVGLAEDDRSRSDRRCAEGAAPCSPGDNMLVREFSCFRGSDLRWHLGWVWPE